MPKRKRGEVVSGEKVPLTYLRSETDLFSEPSYDVTVGSTHPTEYHPISSLTEKNAPLSFFIKGTETQYIDLKETKLYLKCNITYEKKEPLVDIPASGVGEAAKPEIKAPKVFPVNGYLNSMFKKVEVKLNEKVITSSNTTYAYRSYIETLLGFSKEYKKSQATCALYYPDKSDTNNLQDKNDGATQRHEITKESKIFEMMGTPFVDLFMQDRWLMPGIDMRVEFTRSDDEFHLMVDSSKGIETNIIEAKLLVKKRTVLPSVLLNHMKQWESKPILYPMRRVDCKTFTIGPSTLQVVQENLIHGQLPQRMIIGLVNSKAFQGDYKLNPFHFKHFDVSYMNVQVNGEQVSVGPLNLNFDDNVYIEAYDNLFEGLGLKHEDCGLEITKQKFKSFCALYVYNLGQVLEGGLAPPSTGTCKIEIRFKTAPSDALTCIVFSEYSSCLAIDNQKNIWFVEGTHS